MKNINLHYVGFRGVNIFFVITNTKYFSIDCRIPGMLSSVSGSAKIKIMLPSSKRINFSNPSFIPNSLDNLS